MPGPEIGDGYDEQDGAETFDESNLDDHEELNEMRTFEELPDLFDVTSARGDRDEDEALALDAAEFDEEAFTDADLEDDDELRYRAAASEEDDDDFDGRFETRLFYRHGSLERSEVDADGDGLAEWRAAYRDGVLDTATIIEPATGLPMRVEHYHLGRLTEAEQDDNGDGRLDTRLRYGPLGQVTSREPLP